MCPQPETLSCSIFSCPPQKKKQSVPYNAILQVVVAEQRLFSFSANLTLPLPPPPLPPPSTVMAVAQMSYSGPGSIYSIGLHNISVLCVLLPVASLISMTAFWGRIQGKLGSLDDSLSETLYKVHHLETCCTTSVLVAKIRPIIWREGKREGWWGREGGLKNIPRVYN